MNPLLIGSAILAMFCSAGGMLLMWIFGLAAAPNGTPEQLRILKLWVIGFTAGSVACIALAALLLWLKRPGWATSIGILPTAVMGITFLVKAIR